MAVVELQAKSKLGNTTQEFERLYRAWRYAHAQWELAENDPATDGLTNEEADKYCDVEHEALLAFFDYDAKTPAELARKLRVLRDVRGWDYTAAPAIIGQLFKDANTIAFGHDGD
ncbi:MAG: hypothetical protein AAGB23_07700 [Pseudomonadota bacterium]